MLTYFRGSELQNYFLRILEDNIKAIIKPQYVDHIPKAVRGNVGLVLDQKDQRGVKPMLLEMLDLEQVGLGAGWGGPRAVCRLTSSRQAGDPAVCWLVGMLDFELGGVEARLCAGWGERGAGR